MEAYEEAAGKTPVFVVLCNISRTTHVSQPYAASDSQVQTLGRDLAAALPPPHERSV